MVSEVTEIYTLSLHDALPILIARVFLWNVKPEMGVTVPAPVSRRARPLELSARETAAYAGCALPVSICSAPQPLTPRPAKRITAFEIVPVAPVPNRSPVH